MASSNTQRTLDRLRKDGAIVDVVEKWINVPGHPGGGVRRDMFGIFDIVALLRGNIVGIQSTGITNRSEHLSKMLAEPRLTHWLNCGGKAELWAWKKVKNRWEPRIQTICFVPTIKGSDMTIVYEDLSFDDEMADRIRQRKHDPQAAAEALQRYRQEAKSRPDIGTNLPIGSSSEEGDDY